jgi:class 3 adenylate cyclase
MTDCGHCGAANAPQRRFCHGCGGTLTASCPDCRYTNEPDDRFCGGCGSSLNPGSGREGSSPERRHLSLMFCDLVGSTALAESLDPEVLREVYRTYQGLAGETIDKPTRVC